MIAYLIYAPSVIVPLALYLMLNHINSYWKWRDLPYIPGTPLFGNLKDVILRISAADLFVQFCNDPKTKDQAFTGIHIFHKPAVLIAIWNS